MRVLDLNFRCIHKKYPVVVAAMLNKKYGRTASECTEAKDVQIEKEAQVI